MNSETIINSLVRAYLDNFSDKELEDGIECLDKYERQILDDDMLPCGMVLPNSFSELKDHVGNCAKCKPLLPVIGMLALTISINS